jgi:hypothetical protein
VFLFFVCFILANSFLGMSLVLRPLYQVEEKVCDDGGGVADEEEDGYQGETESDRG